MAEFGSRARVATWQLDVKRTGAAGADNEWTIADQERISSVENIYRVSLNAAKQFAAHDLKIAAEDLDLTLTEGSRVRRRDRRRRHRPWCCSARAGQLPSVAGDRTGPGQDFLRQRDARDALRRRLHPRSTRPTSTRSSTASALHAGAGRSARAASAQRRSFAKSRRSRSSIDLGDLSREPWSLLPRPGRFPRRDAHAPLRHADLRALRHRSRKTSRCSIASATTTSRSTRRRRSWRSAGRSTTKTTSSTTTSSTTTSTSRRRRTGSGSTGARSIRLKVRSPVLGTLTFRLADSLVVQSIVSDQFGRLFGIRVKNQNTLVVNLPTPLTRDSELTLTIAYAGRLEPQTPDREALAPAEPGQQARAEDQPMLIAAEPSYLYSNRSYWYPQATVTDYATATHPHLRAGGGRVRRERRARGRVPGAACRQGSGAEPQDLPVHRGAAAALSGVHHEPLLARRDGDDRLRPAPASRGLAGKTYRSLNLSVEANPRQVQRGREVGERAADIALFYESLLGDSPYPSFTVALVESDLPGGHSPGYFAVLNQPLPTSPLVWRNDPAAFSNYPGFLHRARGRAPVVGAGGRLAQLPRAVAQRRIRAVLRRALRAAPARRRDVRSTCCGRCASGASTRAIRGRSRSATASATSAATSRVFRALVYNKGAAVLHMLRRLVGDEAFFRGCAASTASRASRRSAPTTSAARWRRKPARPLERFFEQWIYGSTLPQLKVGYRVERHAAARRAARRADRRGLRRAGHA